MKLEEALPALKENKKIRRTSWGYTTMVQLKNNLFYYPNSDYSIRSIRLEVEDILAEDWEILD